jgi:predicted nucleic acid-binding protein
METSLRGSGANGTADTGKAAPGHLLCSGYRRIYFVKQHPIYFPAVKKLLHRTEAGELTAVMSSLVFAELLVPAYRAGEIERAETLIRLLMEFPHLQISSRSPEISVEAARLRASCGMRTPDASHAATALKTGANAIVSNDKNFLKNCRWDRCRAVRLNRSNRLNRSSVQTFKRRNAEPLERWNAHSRWNSSLT